MNGGFSINNISGATVIQIGQARHLAARNIAHQRHEACRGMISANGPNTTTAVGTHMTTGVSGCGHSAQKTGGPISRYPFRASPQQRIMALELENSQLRVVIQELKDQLRDAFAHIRVTREERSQIIQESRAVVQKIKNHQLENLACATISNVLIAAIGGPLTLGLSAISGVISTFLSAGDTAKLVSRCDFLLDALDGIQ